MLLLIFKVLLEAFRLVQRCVWDLSCSPRNSPSTVCNGRTIGGIEKRPSAVVPLRALRKSFPLAGLDDLWTENSQQEVPERLSEQCLSGGSCRLRAPTAHWFPGTFLNEIGNSTSTKTSWGPGWKFFTSLETVSTDCLQQTAAWRVQNQRFTPAVCWWRGVAVADYMGWLLATWCRENVQYKFQT